MSGPFKMKYQGSPLNMFGGVKSSPVRSWWNRMFGKEKAATAGQNTLDEGGGTNVSTVPQHGSEAHSGRDKGGGSWMGRTFGGNLGGGGGSGGNNQNPMMGMLAILFGGGGGLI